MSAFALGGQTGAYSSFWKLSSPEKNWVIFHPFIAAKAFRITAEARKETEKLLTDSLLDSDPYGGKVDAFRHTYWMARLAQKMRYKKALRLGIAHEKANHISFINHQPDEEGSLPDSVSSEMDLFNNSVGVAIGCNFREASPKEIYDLVISAIEKGKVKIIRKDRSGKDVDCEGRQIDYSVFTGQWQIPKCLVNSDFHK
jgi:hypothetical protein